MAKKKNIGPTSTAARTIDSASDRRKAAPSQVMHEPAYHEIAEAAYHRYLERGGGDGGDLDDWLEAERGLRSRN